MKKVGLFLLAVVMVAGYAGCGGNDDGFPNECEAYCQTVCDKSFVCTNTPKIESQIDLCLDYCQGYLEDAGYDASGVCTDMNALLSSLSCNDVLEIAGLRSTAPDLGRLIAHSLKQ